MVPDAPAHHGNRIPDDAPFVLAPRRRRAVKVYGTIYLGIPTGAMAIVWAVMTPLMPDGMDAGAFALGMLAILPVCWIVGTFQTLLVVTVVTSGGPYLAAGPTGLWIRARKVPARAVFLPWDAVRRIYVRRWLFDRVICVQARNERAGARAGSLARLDMSVQRTLFGAGLTASTFYGGRSVDEVLAALRRLAPEGLPIG